MEGSQTASEFRNDSGGILGVVKRNAEDKLRGTYVAKGETVWLDTVEQVATANAPKREADNPFTNGFLKLVTKQGEIEERRPIGDRQEEPQAPEAETVVTGSEGEAPEGENAPGEVADTPTPEAEQAAAEAVKAEEEKARAAAENKAKAAAQTSEQEQRAKEAAARTTQPPVPPDTGAAKPAAPQRPQGSRASGEVVADTPPQG